MQDAKPACRSTPALLLGLTSADGADTAWVRLYSGSTANNLNRTADMAATAGVSSLSAVQVKTNSP